MLCDTCLLNQRPWQLAPEPGSICELLPSEWQATEFSIEARIAVAPENRRRTTRVPLSVPIKVSGTLADGKPFEEQTTTVVIDGHGAQIVLKNHARPGQRLTITNLRSGKACPFRLG